MGALADFINDALNMDPIGTTTEARDTAVRERQLKDRQAARQSLVNAKDGITRSEYQPAIAHALVGILALQMSET